MTRISKKEEIRGKCPKKRKPKLSKKTGPLKDNLQKGYKEHANALSGHNAFIPKI